MRFLFYIFLIQCALITQAYGRDKVQFYLEKYGRADSKNEWVQRTTRVFEKIYQVADKKHHRLPKLAIINSPNDPWAVALPDGYIILSQQAINLCYRGVSPEMGDARIGFVLGHELAHLANDDFWHNEVVHFLADKNAKPDDQYEKKIRHDKELAADDRGFIYAAMAGYDVRSLLFSEINENNFFYWWQQQTVFDTPNSHPDPEKRAQFLEKRLQTILEKITFFQFGVRLSYFDRCEDGVYFLREFQTVFPSREVFNNLGYCYIRLAVKEMGRLAYLYWLPAILDVSTRAEGLATPPLNTLRSTAELAELPEIAREHLEDAQKTLRLAIESDPFYLPAYLNLTIVQLYLGDIYAARSTIEQARKLEPDNLEIKGLRALIIYEEGKETDTWITAITQLQELAELPNAPLTIVYNTARLLDFRKRSGAMPLWERLATELLVLPPPIRQTVCQKVSCTPPASVSVSAKQEWILPFNLGTYLKRDEKMVRLLTNWKKMAFDWNMELYGSIYQHPEKTIELLELVGYAEMAVLKLNGQESLQSIKARCGNTLINTKFTQGDIWSCHSWAAWVKNEVVREIWIVRE